METRQLGASGLRVTRMGIGLAALGRPAYITLGHADDLAGARAVEALRARTAGVLDAAWDAGIRYVDAARSYGRAEDFLGSWLQDRPPERRPVIGSKWGYEYTADWRIDAVTHEVKEHSLAMFERQLAETVAQLGRPPDLYQVHSVTLDSGALDDAALLDALGELRAAGTPVGVSLSGAGQAETLARVLDVERDGTRLFATVQATWNLLEPSAGAMLGAAHDAGMGVILKEVVANGRLTPRSDDAAVRALLGSIAERCGVTIDAVALAAALAQPWADIVLSGAATVAQLRANLRAFDVVLTASDRAALDALGEPAEVYWSRRGELTWA